MNLVCWDRNFLPNVDVTKFNFGVVMVIRYIALFFTVLGAAGFFFPFWIGLFGALENVELPLSTVDDIAVSTEGDVFIANSFLGRVHKYSPEGKFLHSFVVDAGGGLICLVSTAQHLEVHAARRDAFDTFDFNGNSIRQNSPSHSADFSDHCDLDQKIDYVSHQITFTSIKLSEKDTPIVIRKRIWHYLVFNPFVSWLTFVIGLFLFPEWREGVFSRLKRPKGSQLARPTSIALKVVDAILNVFLTVYVILIAKIFSVIFLAFGAATGADSIILVAIKVFFIAYALNGIFRIWTNYNEFIRNPNPFGEHWIEIGPIRFMAIKAATVVLLPTFIYFTFFYQW